MSALVVGATPHRRSVLVLIALLLTVAISVNKGRAADGRDFAGFYEVSDVTSNADGTVSLTLAVSVFNYSGAEVVNGTISLDDPVRGGVSYGTYGTRTSFGENEHVVLTQQFVIPADEYRRWMEGGRPALYVVHRHPEADERRSPVELVPGAAGEE
jgi:hypothetical protein